MSRQTSDISAGFSSSDPLIVNLLAISDLRGDNAVGIEYIQDPSVYPVASDDTIIATAKQSIVISAGTFGSPAILERSGIGSTSLHEQLGIHTIVDLPGVGQSYQGGY